MSDRMTATGSTVSLKDRRVLLALGAAVLAALSVLAFAPTLSADTQIDGEKDLYGYEITMMLDRPDQVSTVTWDFGDGSPTETITLTAENPNGKAVHRYAAKGDYTVTATMKNQYTNSEGQLVDGEAKLVYIYHILGYPNVTFDSMGGSAVPSIEGKTYKYTIEKPADPTRDGYEFTGWYTDKECTKAFDWTTEIIGKHYTLYAGWKEVQATQYTSTLKYDANGGSGAPSDDVFKGASTEPHAFTVASSAPVREGYRFDGWADSADAASPAYRAGDAVSVAHDGTKTIYAVWTFVLKITSVAEGSATVGTGWSYAIEANAEGCTITVAGADWLSVSDGKIAGTPMKTGTYHVTVTLSKAGCADAVQSFDVVVGPSAFAHAPTASGIIAEVKG